MTFGLCVAGCSSDKKQPPDKQTAGTTPIAHKAENVTNRIDLAWLPSDAELLVRVNVAQVWRAPLLQQLVALPAVQQNVTRMRQMIGLQPADIQSVTLAASGISEQLKRGASPNPVGIATTAGDKALAVVRLNKSVDAASLRLSENRGQPARHAGKTYYRFTPPEGSKSDPVGLYLAGPKQLLIGTEQQIQAAIDRGARQTRRQDLDFIDPDQHLLIAFVPQEMAALTAGLPDVGHDDPAGKAAKLAKKNLKALCLGVRIGSGVDLAVQLQCTGEVAAGEIKQQIDALIKQGRDAFAKSKDKMPPELATAADQVLGSLKTSQTAQTLTASVNISPATIGALKKSGKQLAGMAMTAAMMHGGGMGLPGSTAPGFSPGKTASEPPAVKLPTAAPKGIKTSAIARWSRGRSFANGRELPHPLELWVYLIGKQPERAVAWGDARIEQARTGTGETLSQQNRRSAFGGTTTRFEPVKREGLLSTHPRHGVKTVIRFASPQKHISKIAEVAGIVALHVAAKRKPVVIRNIQSLVGKTIDHPALKQAGVTLRVTRQGSNLNLKLVKGNPAVIGKVTAVDGQGKALRNIGTFRQGFGNRISYGLFLGSRAPKDVGVELSLNLDIHRVDVPFHFTNVRVPVPPNDPGRPSATTSGIPAGLKLAAKTRWSRLSRSTAGGNEPLPPQLEVLVTLEGKPAAQAVGWGRVEIKQAKGPNGLPLKPARSRFGSGAKFHTVDRSRSGSQRSKELVHIPMVLDHPSAAIPEVTSIEGSLLLRIARQRKTLTIPRFPSKVGKPLTSRELQAAGVELKLEKQGNQFKLKLTRGDPLVVGRVDVVDAQGRPLKRSNVYRFAFSKEVTYNISTFGKKLAADAGLRIQIHLDLTTLKVPFRFEHLPVPDPPLQ